uniref:Uncharacterized protein n=1 Tax=Triticum urartu TaxID=4572 RepID=A0A8R7V7F9_TRIUA
MVNDGLSEQTAVYFYLVKGADGKLSTHFCQDAFRSLKANILVKAVYGSFIPVLDGENMPSRTGRMSCRPASSSTPWRSYTSSPTPTPYSLLSFLEIACII